MHLMKLSLKDETFWEKKMNTNSIISVHTGCISKRMGSMGGAGVEGQEI